MQQQFHDLAVGLLAQLMQRQQAPGKAQRILIVTALRSVGDQRREQAGHELSPSLALAHQPQLELGAAVEVEALEQVAAVEVDGGRPRSGVAPRRQLAHPRDVEPVVVRAVKVDRVAVGLEATGQQGRDAVQDPAEVGAPAVFWLVRPEEVGQAFARDGLAVHGQVAQQGDGFARAKVGYRRSVSRHVHCAQ